MSSICVFLSVSGHYTRARHASPLRLYGGEHLFVAGHDALRMTESACALAVGADIEHDVVRTLGIACNSADSGKMIQAEILAQAPGDEVIGAGRIAANPDSAHHLLASGEQGEAAAEDVDAADLAALHWVGR